MKAILFSTLLLFCSSLTFAQDSLVDLVVAGEREEAFALIEQGVDVNVQQSDGTTALLYAIHQGDKELVLALLEAGADANHSNAYGAGVMSEAAQLGDVEILTALLDKGADVNWHNPEGETALMTAARSGNVPFAEILLAHGADVNARESWGGQTALMWASAQGQAEMLTLLIEHGADVNLHGKARLWERRILSEPRPKDMNKGGFSALLYAARQGCTECISILAEAGADLDATDPDRVSSLNLALINLHFETAAALIEAGADVNSWDLFGRAPLYNAIDLNTLPVGGRPDIPSEDRMTGYDVAAMLLERGANPNMQLKLRPPYRNAIYDRGSDNLLSYGATPLIRAARAADVESVRLLLEYGALVDLPNGRGHTPVMVVSGIDWPAEPTRGRYKTEEASIETLDLLLAAGADINALTGDPTLRPGMNRNEANRGAGMQPAIRGAVNIDGQTALHAAAKMGWNKIVQYLIDHGAVQQVVDASNKTPFDLAMGRYEPAFLAVPPVPLLDTARLLQEACEADDNCVMRDTIDFSNPTNLIQ